MYIMKKINQHSKNLTRFLGKSGVNVIHASGVRESVVEHGFLLLTARLVLHDEYHTLLAHGRGGGGNRVQSPHLILPVLSGHAVAGVTPSSIRGSGGGGRSRLVGSAPHVRGLRIFQGGCRVDVCSPLFLHPSRPLGCTGGACRCHGNHREPVCIFQRWVLNRTKGKSFVNRYKISLCPMWGVESSLSLSR